MANEKLSTSQLGLDLITHFEALKLKPYLCSAKKATIGIGSTYYADGTPVKITDKPITKEQAVELFKITLKKTYEPAVRRAITVELTQNQFDALVSLAYNCGSIFKGLASKINKNTKDKSIWGQFISYNKIRADKDGVDNNGNGIVDEEGETKELLGLTRRRNSEAHMYFLGKLDYYTQIK
jgi:lysozyme